MSSNEAVWDRLLRVVAGLVLIALTLAGTIGLWGWLGLVLVVTGAIGWCPIYAVLGLKTRS
jgi:O-antigen ligase